MKNNMKAIIMAGGEGARLRPLTCDMPKPLAPVLGEPVMGHALSLLREHGIVEAAATLKYRAHMIQDAFGDGAAYGMNLSYFIEDAPLGTAGSVKAASGFIDGAFIVLSGDALTDLDITAAYDFHKSKGALATIVLKRVPVPLEYGVVITDGDGRILRFLEKPGWSEVFSDTVNTGIYILEQSVLDEIPQSGAYDFGKELFPKLVRAGAPVYGYVTDGYWCDIGSVESYLEANRDALQGRVRLSKPIMPDSGIFVGEGARTEGATLTAPCYVGEGAVLMPGASVGPHAVIGAMARVAAGASVKRGVLWEGAQVAADAQVRGALLMRDALAERGSELYDDAVLGDRAALGRGVVLKPGVRVWPGQAVEPFARVTANRVLGGEAELFCERGACGSPTALTSERVSLLGLSLAGVLKASTAVVSHDGSGAASWAALAFAGGMAGAGARVFDAGALSGAASRHAMRVLGAEGGMHARMTDGVLHLDVYGAGGVALNTASRRAAEGMFRRGDALRAPCEGIKPVETLGDALLFAAMDVIARADVNRVAPMAVCAPDAPTEEYVRKLLGEAVVVVRESDIPHKGMVSVVIAPDGEGLALFDEDGERVPEAIWTGMCAAMALSLLPGTPLYLTPDAGGAAEIVARVSNTPVKALRHARPARMSGLCGADAAKAFWRDVYFDGAAALAWLARYMEEEGETLAGLVSRIPAPCREDVYVQCPSTGKGRALRRVIEGHRGADVSMDEGVMVRHERGWAWLMPDEDAPRIRVLCEAASMEAAKELSGFYAALAGEGVETERGAESSGVR